MGQRTRTTKILACALLVIVLSTALVAPVSASDSPSSSADEEVHTYDGGPCIVYSTDPPGVGVYTHCETGGLTGAAS